MNKELLLSDIENDLNKMNDRQLKDLGYEFLHTGIISIRSITAEKFEKKVLSKANDVCNVISSAIHNFPFLLFADYNRDMMLWELSECIRQIKHLEQESKGFFRTLIYPLLERGMYYDQNQK
ncbi:hypothetical protein EII15_20250 [Bacillus licheniformis]|uniref:hypothetical protein n=1 Tax=Bacillus licheniformis TaxID=1402 RepID=UPI000F5E1FB1|nr:hypothetical protein [Bacillus licheniformis]RRD96048.1 hypothetical protein EII15_20250 [Bacillus licheniformis]